MAPLTVRVIVVIVPDETLSGLRRSSVVLENDACRTYPAGRRPTAPKLGLL